MEQLSIKWSYQLHGFHATPCHQGNVGLTHHQGNMTYDGIVAFPTGGESQANGRNNSAFCTNSNDPVALNVSLKVF